DLLRAVIESIAFHSRTILIAAHAGDEPTTPLVIGGGLARSDRWCQLRADILQRPVTRTTAEEPGLHGAAMLAMTGLGWYISLDEARRQLAATATTFEPATAEADLIDERYQRFCRYLAWQQQAAV
ncbi:MAG: carbohydrate kinase, partial [Candidatus Competibacteraceae bacterium]|nr:carbohydrate kinase [Candidatus Competibacteraceae bacterium]